jgi:NTE family protein
LIGKGFELVKYGGLYRTDYLRQWIKENLASCNVHTWSDLAYADSRLPVNQRYKLVVVVSDISRGRMLRLPWDYESYLDLDPNVQLVADAITASASIPFFFQPQHLVCGPLMNREKLTLTDGGILSNFPVDLFDLTPQWPTIGVRLSARQCLTEQWRPTNRPSRILRRLFDTMMGARDSIYTDQKSVQDRTIFIDITDISGVSFSLDDKQRDDLYQKGRVAAQKFLSTWDWERWKQEYGGV